MSKKLFGTSGIRGIVNKDLTLRLAVETGLAVGTAIGGGKVTIAHDTRTTATTIENAVVPGLLGGARAPSSKVEAHSSQEAERTLKKCTSVVSKAIKETVT